MTSAFSCALAGDLVRRVASWPLVASRDSIAHRLDVAEHHRDAVRPRARRSCRGRLDVLPVSSRGGDASEGRHVSEAGRRADRRAAAGPGRRPRGVDRPRPAARLAPASRSSSSIAARSRACSRRFDRSGPRPACRIAPKRWSPTSRRRLDRSCNARRPRRRSRRVLFIIGRRPGMLADLVAVGPGSYLNDLIEIAGGTNVLDIEGQPEYPRISMETVLRLDPDVIIDTVDMGETEAERRQRAADQRAPVGRVRHADRRQDRTAPRGHDRRARRAGAARRRSRRMGGGAAHGGQ